MRRSTQEITYLLLTLTAVIWGGNYIANKVLMRELAPLTAAVVRFASAAALMLVVLGLRRQLRLLTRAELKGVAGLGVIFFLHNLFYYFGLERTTAINASLLMATSPVITCLLAERLAKERVSLLQLAGTLLSLGGVFLVVTGEAGVAVRRVALNAGDLLMLFSAATWSLYSLQGKGLMATLTPLETTVYSWVVGTGLLLPVAFLFRSRAGHWLPVSAPGWWSLAYVVVLSAVVAFSWWYRAIDAVGAARSSAFINLVPLSVLILAALLLGETVSYSQVGGAGCILFGVYLASLQETLAAKTGRVRFSG
ncbi:MAG: DMT family transporter [Bacillota bacterium]|nr:DMT family transporter [Bacillota bacterium]